MEKNENKQFAVGLDIGTTKIVAMVGQKNKFNKVEIIGIGKSKSLGVHRGVVNNITQTIQSIQEAVNEAELKSSTEIKNVVVGIAGQHIRSIQHSDYITRKNPEEVINENDVEKLINQVYKLVMLPGEEIIHVLPQEFKVDGQAEIKEPIGMYGGRLEANFHVVVGQVSSIKNIGRCIKSADLKMEKITLEPIASSDAVLSEEEKEAGVALVDIGGGTTDLAIFKDGIIRHTSVIPFGGNVVTDDIKEGCSIIQKQAELLKIKFGSAWPGENKETEIVSIPGLITTTSAAQAFPVSSVARGQHRISSRNPSKTSSLPASYTATSPPCRRARSAEIDDRKKTTSHASPLALSARPHALAALSPSPVALPRRCSIDGPPLVEPRRPGEPGEPDGLTFERRIYTWLLRSRLVDFFTGF